MSTSAPSTDLLVSHTRQHLLTLLAADYGDDQLSPMDLQKITDSLHKLHRIEKENQGMISSQDVDGLILATGRAVRHVILKEHSIAPLEPVELLDRLGTAMETARLAWEEKAKK